ncbi:ATP synthase protein I2 [Lachnospiraceae bacterium KM106-2]|nr:ATP synthase protein I2 [Lachnospiraceae bacterium KM106-2]
MREEKLTFFEMITGIVIYITVLTVIGGIVPAINGSIVRGILFGGLFSILILTQLYFSLQKTLELDQNRAEKYSVRHAIIRLFLMGVALVVGILAPKIFNVLGIMLGILGLKAGAYLQPSIHKIINQKYNKGR